ncbi:MAG: alpha-ribazole phosphatase [Anaerolineae bacterium]
MLRLLLIRHGETDWNAQGRYQGQTDIPLNAVGWQQAQALAQRLAREPLTAIYASDLRRAGQTATVIAEPHQLPVRHDPRLREMRFGVFEGLTYAEIAARYPEALAAWQQNRDTPPPGGEALAAFSARVRDFFDAVIAAHDDAAVLVVAHGGALRDMICRALDIPADRRWNLAMDNASLSELHLYEGGAVLYRLNDTAHLDAVSEGAHAMSSA